MLPPSENRIRYAGTMRPSDYPVMHLKDGSFASLSKGREGRKVIYKTHWKNLLPLSRIIVSSHHKKSPLHFREEGFEAKCNYAISYRTLKLEFEA
jgi:hypothetical protein